MVRFNTVGCCSTVLYWCPWKWQWLIPKSVLDKSITQNMRMPRCSMTNFNFGGCPIWPFYTALPETDNRQFQIQSGTSPLHTTWGCLKDYHPGQPAHPRSLNFCSQFLLCWLPSVIFHSDTPETNNGRFQVQSRTSTLRKFSLRSKLFCDHILTYFLALLYLFWICTDFAWLYVSSFECDYWFLLDPLLNVFFNV